MRKRQVYVILHKLTTKEKVEHWVLNDYNAIAVEDLNEEEKRRILKTFTLTTGMEIEDLVGWYEGKEYIDNFEEKTTTVLPITAVRGSIKSILILINGRIYAEEVEGWISDEGRLAFIEKEVWEKLF